MLPEELPVKPKIFVGRDKLVHSTIQSLLESRDVALIGPGGMGKSSIARAVLNDDALTTKFQKRRFFVRFDDMDAAQITFGTFLDRIARALGFGTLANTHNLITKALSTSETLLVLDNAETFLDAATDAGRIADAIDGFGERANVAILLTTRTTVLPPNLKWVRLRVPSLEEGAACEAFTMFYTPSIESSILVKLLSAVDFHPLSINLLAQAAVQNDWSPEDLVDAWDRQRTTLLEAGDGKIQSIAVTIETSLNSPSVLKLGVTILRLLQVIAYLPQGISKQRLTAIFPGVTDIEACAEALCKQSLAYINGGFITLLAPIRLYISNRYNTTIVDNLLLQKVRQYYKAHADEEEIVRQDDVNIEYVFAHWVTDPVAMTSVLDLIGDFIYTLLDCRPRPIALRPVIASLDPSTSRQPVSFIDFLRAFPTLHPRRVEAMVEKGTCLFAISTLMRWIGQNVEAEATVTEARKLLFESGILGRSRLLLIDWGTAMVYVEQGNFVAAEELFKSTLQNRNPLFMANKHFKAVINIGLSRVDLYRGRRGSSKLCLKALPVMKDIGTSSILVMCWYQAGAGEMNDGNLALAKKYFQTARDAVEEEPSEEFYMSLIGLAEVALRLGDREEAKALRAQALESVQGSPDQTLAYASEVVSILAAYLAMEGNVEQARELIGPAVANAIKHLSKRAVRCSYLAGCELIGGDFDKAEAYFKETIEACISVLQFTFHAVSERALGEIAVTRQDWVVARAHFEATSKLCETMGVSKDGMYREHACYMLGETFNGWKLYQEGYHMFRT
ncbi:hypothetical protein H0H87_000987 [Tephrocybe sp. NHM501043]|nr:hypothetical protein H0H87_000987 [Tephrocybe sp. NHM501043]